MEWTNKFHSKEPRMSADGSDIIFNARGAMEPADFSLGDYWNEIKPLET